MVEVDEKKCRLCGVFSSPVCVDRCADGALALRDRRIVVTEFLCEDCNECGMACPDRAITIKKVTF